MAVAGLLAITVWGDDWTMAAGLLFILGLPAVLLTLLPLPDFRWESVTASAAGLALGMAAGVSGTFGSEDSDNALLWYGAMVYCLFGFAAYTAVGLAVKVVVHSLSQRMHN
jgi:hypothetical protein